MMRLDEVFDLVDLLRSPVGELPDPLPLPTLAEAAGLDPLDPASPAAAGAAAMRGAKLMHAEGRPDAFDAGLRLVPPGSKSLTNRALLLAALAEGDSILRGALLDADDARRMLVALKALGVDHRHDPLTGALHVAGLGGRLLAPDDDKPLFLNNAGTATRFLSAAALLADRPVVIDGNARMRERPLGELIALLRTLGATIDELETPGFVPIRVHPLRTPAARTLDIPTTQSSQFVSALLMVAPRFPGGLRLRLVGNVTSRSYIDMTVRLMRECAGVDIAVAECNDTNNLDGASLILDVPHAPHGAFDYHVEPDASGATYLWAAAALFPGLRVRVPGMTFASLQADARFLFMLKRLGAGIEYAAGAADCTGLASLRPADPTDDDSLDFEQMPDAAMTLAAVAAFADGPTTLTGLRTLRVKETDRIAATAAELDRIGVRVDTADDRLTVHGAGPAAPLAQAPPVVFHTYDDHRMAMAMSLVCLRRPNAAIAEPACVAKTFPDYFAVFASLYEAAALGAAARS